MPEVRVHVLDSTRRRLHDVQKQKEGAHNVGQR